MKMRIDWLPMGAFRPEFSHPGKRETKRRRSVAATLLTCLLWGLPTLEPQAQIVIGGFNFGGGATSGTTVTAADSTSFQGQAAAVSGVAMGSAVSVADTGPLSAAGGAYE